MYREAAMSPFVFVFTQKEYTQRPREIYYSREYPMMVRDPINKSIPKRDERDPSILRISTDFERSTNSENIQ